MKVEILFPEFCNLYGDLKNADYLKRCLPEADFIETALHDDPAFLTEDIRLLYMGPMTEHTQEKIIEKFRPHTERIRQLMESGAVFLFTGNAFEIMGQYIENEDGSRIEALGIFDFYVKRDMMHRHNSSFMGNFEDMVLLGFKTQFTMCYPTGNEHPFIQVKKGVGLNRSCKYEGIHYRNFFGTYLIGPILIMNPAFTEKLFTIIGEGHLAFEKEVKAAYEKRLQDFINKT